MRVLPGVLAVAAAVLATSPAAQAFCGFYVAGGDQKMFNDATQVVLMRDGTRTVLSMQNNYKGPPENFAMVVPVPVVLQEADVKTLPPEVFQHVEQMGAPRLVEYWEMDPCSTEPDYKNMPVPSAMPAGGGTQEMVRSAEDLGVKIEAKFTVGEYDILILSAKEATGLDTWLRQEKYTIPAGAEPLLRPYVEAGMKFFVAKVDISKVKWAGEGNDKRAALSPLRFHYDHEEFSLPIRLGLANSAGTQDLIVNILAPGQRYEVANYKNATIPTNIDVRPEYKDKFAAFYTALFDRTIEKHPGAVITEYAWQATTCDPCPGPALDQNDFATLGADVLKGNPDGWYDFVLTRLHARYGKDITNDLSFKKATPIVGGREFLETNGKLEEGAKDAPVNNFQGRYAIRHEWTGPIKCDKPVRKRWGGPPSGQPDPGVQPAVGIAFAPRGAVMLSGAVLRDVPEIDVKAGASTDKPPVASGSGSAMGSAAQATPPSMPSAAEPKKKSGCGCSAERNDLAGGALLVGVMFAALRRRRRS